MFNRLRLLISPPILRDEAQNRAAALLNILLWIALLFSALLTGAALSMGGQTAQLPATIFGAVVLLLFIGLLILMRRGRVRLASWVYVGLALAVSTILIYSQGSLRTPFTILLALIIVAAGLLLGERAAFATALYSALVTFLLLIGESRGLLRPALPASQLVMWIIYAAAFAILAGLLALTTRLINRAFTRAQENEQRLVDSIRELMDVRASLETRVTDRTQEIVHHMSQLQAATEVGSAIVSLRDLGELLTEATRLVSQRFGYYHIGVFLLDPGGENVQLKASNSSGGERMLAQGHKLAVGSKSVVGTVAQTRKPRIVSDVGQDTIYFQNPDLPDTHAEMALPLAVGEKFLGVLDAQSTLRGAFTPIDAVVLKVVADQLAVAIENARLFSENESALEDIRRAYGELNRAAWGKLLSTRPSQGYRCDEDGRTLPVSGEWPEEMQVAEESATTTSPDPQTVAIPVKFGEDVRGVIRLRKPVEESWSKDEIEFMEDLSEQLYVALESARLYQETQRRAERERLAAEITARMRASNDPQTILQTAVQDLRQALQAQRAQVVIQPNEPPGNGKIELKGLENL
jgi:GAF domain-containing protein